MENDGYEDRLELALKALLECDNPDTLDLVYRILVMDKIDGRAD